MNRMTTAFSALAEVRQERLDSDKFSDVENPITPQQAKFLAKFETDLSEIDQARNLLCSAFLLNHLGANEFLDAISQNRLVGSVELFMKAYATGVLALAAQKGGA
jgi:hypothetical protein